MDSTENEHRDNSVVGVKLFNIEAGLSPLSRETAPRRARRRRSVSHRDTQKILFIFFVPNVLSRLISTFQYDKAAIMMFHFDSI